MPMSPLMRALLGFLAAVISVLTFHAAAWAALHVLNPPGMGMPPPYPMDPVPPFGVPKIASLCFWGGLYGAAFGLLLPRITAPIWLAGLVLGLIAGTVGMLLVPAIKGGAIGGGWLITSWTRSFLINGAWGIGVGLILPWLMPRTVAPA
jgi:hypothetical protein